MSCQKHPESDLLIWNYTQKCQFAKEWTEETMMARGLITDLEGNIKSRPFKKFFNYEEHFGDDCKLQPLPLEEFTVTEKMDGSLGILYFMPDGEPRIATRGSFTSDQAIKGTQILHKKLRDTKNGFITFDRQYTWLFEIIYPENRIVVDYGKTEDLILLACINTETGEETPVSIIDSPFTKVKSYDFKDLSKIKEIQEPNAEGFVIRFKSGVRTKIKFAEYVRLHRLVTGVNAKTIWELLRNDDSFDDLLERVPDEFYEWVKETRKKLENEYEVIDQVICKNIYDEVRILPTRKEQAMSMMGNEQDRQYAGIVFKMLDGEDYKDQIWKMIRPKAEKPWKEDSDA